VSASRLRVWAQRETAAAPLVRFRVAFASIWLLYDVLDVTLSGTARLHNWAAPSAPLGLVAIQLGLIVGEALMVLGAPGAFVAPATLMAAALRGVEWYAYFPLNDFAYCALTALILAHVSAPGGALRMPASAAQTPRWPRDVLVLQAAWIYFATGALKLNPEWLSGRHLFVRLQYLHEALGWHYPVTVLRCADSLPCDATLAILGVVAELTLAALLVLRPRRRIVAPLAVAIHAFGALATNVWFFGPSLVAQVAFLTGDGKPGARLTSPRQAPGTHEPNRAS
jgi:hypothetical protein